MSDLEAKDVMTEGVYAIQKDETVRSAAQEMKEKGTRSLVVVDEDEVVGIVVARDVLYEITAPGEDAETALVSQVMTSDLITADPHDDVSDISRAMLENDISRIPILRGETLVGIVTHEDILRAWPGYVDLLEEKAASGRSDL
ncbi:MAG: CBS domain-containing protein [Candidatus Nanohaloarchaea archaeon]|nr:CBS domain-containing protein [Candidatus Nanohaloarchaea archaeon]